MVVKRRLIIWLIKAYIQRWGKIIVLYFFLGLAAFFLLLVAFSYIAPKLPLAKREVIGAVGAYTVDTIPDYILENVSTGLTKVGPDGLAQPGIASSWGIENNGKKYVFHIKPNLYFSDGTKVTSDAIHIDFTDVTVSRPDAATISFQLKDSYAPFLISVSHPIFKKGFVGVGEYTINDIKLNGNFIEKLTLVSTKDTAKIKTYDFYPSFDALRIAFALGEVTKAQDLPDTTFKNTSFEHFPNVKITRNSDASQLVTIFYNTQDKNLSDKKLRDALAYALPNSFPFGQRAYSPISPQSWAFQADSQHAQDQEHARLLLQSAGYTAANKIPEMSLTVLSQYKSLAAIIVKSWKDVGVPVKVMYADTIPGKYEIYLGNFNVPKDPDQYTLWHSDQVNNITGYKNLRIDKLLEDGRKTTDLTMRAKIYANFQKYLIDDQPASFLYFPYSYTVTRK